MAKADTNYVKKWVENLFCCPFKKDTKKSHDSVQYDTARNLTLRSIILRRTLLRAVSYCVDLRKNNISAKTKQ